MKKLIPQTLLAAFAVLFFSAFHAQAQQPFKYQNDPVPTTRLPMDFDPGGASEWMISGYEYWMLPEYVYTPNELRGANLFSAWTRRTTSSGNLISDWDSYRSSRSSAQFKRVAAADGGWFVVGSEVGNPLGFSAFDDLENRPRRQMEALVLKYSAAGSVEWAQTLQGAIHDGVQTQALSVAAAPNGDLVVLGNTYARQGGDIAQPNKTSPYFPDLWLMRLNAGGTLLWEQCLGSTSRDSAYVNSLSILPNGNILVGATANGAVFGSNSQLHSRGGSDYWITMLSPDGSILWERNYGSSGNEHFVQALHYPDSGFVLLGGHSSNPRCDEDMWDAPARGGSDIWLVLVDVWSGDIIWDGLYGGSGWEELVEIEMLEDQSALIYAKGESAAGPFEKQCSGSPWVFNVESYEGIWLGQRCLATGGSDQIPVGVEIRDDKYHALWFGLETIDPPNVDCYNRDRVYSHSVVNDPRQIVKFARYVGEETCVSPPAGFGDCKNFTGWKGSSDTLYLPLTRTVIGSDSRPVDELLCPDGVPKPCPPSSECGATCKARKLPEDEQEARRKTRRDITLALRDFNLTANQGETYIRLDWKTDGLSLSPMAPFTVERGEDLRSLKPLAELNPSNGTWIDRTPLDGSSWYRLRAVAADGKTLFSNAVEIRRMEGGGTPNQSSAPTLSPTPADGFFTVRLEAADAPATLLVFDLTGRLIHEESLPEGAVELRVETLEWASGLYTGAIVRNSGQDLTPRFRVWVQH